MIRFYTVLAVATVIMGVSLMIGFAAFSGAAHFLGPEFTRYLYLLGGLILISQFFGLTDKILLEMSLELLSGPIHVARKFFTVSVGILFLWSGFHVEEPPRSHYREPHRRPDGYILDHKVDLGERTVPGLA